MARDLDLAPDPIAAAIAAPAEPPQVAMVQKQVTISSTGRPAVVLVPADATPAELAELCGWMLTTLRVECASRGAPASRIILPG